MTRFAWQRRFGCLLAAAALASLSAGAPTLPISYLRLVPEADALHLEVVFNPFELSFLSEVDENKDNELSPAELEAHGPALASRVTAALQISVGTREARAEPAVMDPGGDGHHVRLRARYRVDARRLPLTLESDLISLTSTSHVTQVTYAHPEGTQTAQLDSLARKITFTPPPERKPPPTPPPPPQRAALGVFLLLLGVLALLVAGAGFLMWARRRIEQ
jgi:hypothetical protein